MARISGINLRQSFFRRSQSAVYRRRTRTRTRRPERTAVRLPCRRPLGLSRGQRTLDSGNKRRRPPPARGGLQCRGRRQPGCGPSGHMRVVDDLDPLTRALPRRDRPDPHEVQVFYRVSRETWCPCGSDTPGIPFSGFPVCNLSDPLLSIENSGPLMNFPASSGLLRLRTCLFPTQAQSRGNPRGLSPLSNAPSSVRPSRWGCQDPPEPTHSVSTLSAGRPGDRVQNLPGLFHPDHVLELCAGSTPPDRFPKKLTVWKRIVLNMFPRPDQFSEPVFLSEVFLPTTLSNGFPQLSSYALSLMSQITV